MIRKFDELEPKRREIAQQLTDQYGRRFAATSLSFMGERNFGLNVSFADALTKEEVQSVRRQLEAQNVQIHEITDTSHFNRYRLG